MYESLFDLIEDYKVLQITRFATAQKYASNNKNLKVLLTQKHVEQTMVKHLIFYSDGGARGNPGPAAAAFLAIENNEIIKTESQYIGIRTNNQAEYEALIMSLGYALNNGAEEITCYLDSELVGCQMTGKYRVKNPELQKLYLKAHAIRVQFKKAEFYNVARTNAFIQKADALVNKVLDKQTY